jgi:hypothetical protein
MVMTVAIHADAGLFQGVMAALAKVLSRGPVRHPAALRVVSATPFEVPPEAAPQEPPLPLCQPLNSAERDEVATLARLRGALYAKDH